MPTWHDAHTMNRPYAQIVEQLATEGDKQQRMRTLVDVLWKELSPLGVSWVGFYLDEGNDELVLGPSRNKPACSPIGLHGACGRAFRERRPLVVRDVANLGANYVACDPRDLSEVVIPVFDPDGTCWGVLDVDSFDRDAFDQSDVDGLLTLLRAAELTGTDVPMDETLMV
jgi:putative methionine-R-sulfoxide reductase with GAF domain